MNWRQWWGAANKGQWMRSLLAIWFLVRDARTPRVCKLLAWAVLAYALSPIDLIPDFIPVLGLLDDLILLPLGVMLVVKLTPPALWQDMQAQAAAFQGRLPRLLGGLVLVASLWLLLGGLLAWGLWRTWSA